MMKTIEQRFQNYVKCCYGSGTLPAQLATARMAWFASAFEVLNLITLEIAELPEPQAMAKLQEFANESQRVCEELAQLSTKHN